MQEFYKHYCRDIQQWRFIELYETSVEPSLGYLVIDFVTPQFKYRINSLNIYYNTQHQQLQYIYGKSDDHINEQNINLKYRIQSFLNNSKGLLSEKIDDRVQKEESSCPLCREYLTGNVKDAINQHLESEHKILFSAAKTPICGFCNSDFKTIKDVVAHLEGVHQHKILC
jgi:hypothetical protein